MKICLLSLKDELIGPDSSAMERDIFLNENTEVLLLNWESFGSIFVFSWHHAVLLAVCLSAAAMGVQHWCLLKLNKILLQIWPCLNFFICGTEYCVLKDACRSWNEHLRLHMLVFSSYVNAFFSAGGGGEGFFYPLLYTTSSFITFLWFSLFFFFSYFCVNMVKEIWDWRSLWYPFWF